MDWDKDIFLGTNFRTQTNDVLRSVLSHLNLIVLPPEIPREAQSESDHVTSTTPDFTLDFNLSAQDYVNDYVL